jgi:predicted PurR-regulated permease PerM
MVLQQVETFGKNLPAIKEKVFSVLPAGGMLQQKVDGMLQGGKTDATDKVADHVVMAGGLAFGGLTEAALVLVIAFYLMVDGPGIHQWALAFFPRRRQAKLKETSEGIAQVIFAYVWGQAITSALVMIFSFAVLSIFKVPGALMLSLMAAVFDVLPLLGFFLFTIPAVLVAMSVSPEAAYMVAGLYLLYHLFENYFIVPKVYGKRMRISTLTVLLGLMGGGILGGVPGALVALPIIASYSVIERIWLTPYLHPGVAEKHKKLEEKEFGKEPR